VSERNQEFGRFARIVARWLLIEIAIATPVERDEQVHALGACWLCGSELRAHERSERICDVCLRVNQTRVKQAA
jgi:transcription initiation factor IIE alpha subunit